MRTVVSEVASGNASTVAPPCEHAEVPIWRGEVAEGVIVR